MREYLNKILTAKQTRAAALRDLITNATTADEVRTYGNELTEVENEEREAQAQLNALDATERNAGTNVSQQKFNPLATYGMRYGGQRSIEQDTDPYDTTEYRTAFMDYTCRNIPIPAQLRASATTMTADASAVIPTTILNEIIKELKQRGSIWNKVRKLNVQGGVEIPILSLKPTAQWIGENKAADSQKLSAKDTVSFKYYGLECKIAQSLLTNVTTLPMFQELFVQLATEAIIDAIEIGVFNGSGTGQMLGITKDSRVPAANKIAVSDADIGKWDKWKKNVFAKIKLSYGSGSFFMAKSTFDTHIDGMVDAQGQPIARVNYGITEGSPYRFGGKVIELVEDDIIKPYETASAGDVIAVFVNLNDYGINTNMEMKVDKWEDKDTHEIKNNCILILDGKLIDVNGVLLITKGSAV